MGGRIIRNRFWGVGELLGGKIIIIFGKIWGSEYLEANLGEANLEAIRYFRMKTKLKNFGRKKMFQI